MVVLKLTFGMLFTLLQLEILQILSINSIIALTLHAWAHAEVVAHRNLFLVEVKEILPF